MSITMHLSCTQHPQTQRILDRRLCAPSYLELRSSVTALGPNQVKSQSISKTIRLKIWQVIALIGQLVGFTRLVEMLFGKLSSMSMAKTYTYSIVLLTIHFVFQPLKSQGRRNMISHVICGRQELSCTYCKLNYLTIMSQHFQTYWHFYM